MNIPRLSVVVFKVVVVLKCRILGYVQLVLLFLARMWLDLPRTTFSNRVNSLYTNTGYVSIYANRG